MARGLDCQSTREGEVLFRWSWVVGCWLWVVGRGWLDVGSWLSFIHFAIQTDYRLSTHNILPTTHNQPPTTHYQPPTTDLQLPTTNLQADVGRCDYNRKT